MQSPAAVAPSNGRPIHSRGGCGAALSAATFEPRFTILLLTFDRNALTLTSNVYRRFLLAEDSTNLLQGTLDLMILKSLVLQGMHGLGISRRIEQITRGTFQVKPGSLFPALHRMEEAGWLASSWGESENNRRAKYYRLTKAGRRQLETETQRWGRISLAIARALEAS